MQGVLVFDELEPKVQKNGLTVSHHTVRSILNRANGSLKGFDYTINPYVGCQFGCAYCYAVFFVPDAEKAEKWGTWVEVKENALAALRRTPNVAGSKIYIGSATDPYQPIEREYEITRSLLQFIVEIKPQPSITIQTRSPLVTRDVDLLRQFQDVRVNMSITTDCDEVRKQFEPGCASIDQRFRALESLRDAEISIGLSLCPMLPIRNAIAFAARIKALRPDRFYTGWFHETRGLFAAGTRVAGLELAKSLNWTERDFDHVKQLLQEIISPHA